MPQIPGFEEFRRDINERILRADNRAIKRFFVLDADVYREGHLSARTKELMGLVASMVLRCDDCITYHLIQCHREGVTSDELFEAFSVALTVGGSIVIPHLRRAVAVLEELSQQ
ncbi:MAG: carboxymuconolactone decarboxylase family protein [Bacillota bacterium]